MRRTSVLVAVASLIALSAPLSVAQDDADHPLQGLLDAGSRSSQVHVRDGAAQVAFARDNRTGQDDMLLVMDAARGVVHIGVDDQDVGSSAWRLDVERVLAFEDHDRDGAFHPRIDTLIWSHAPHELAWHVAPIEPVAQRGLEGHLIAAEAALPGFNATGDEASAKLDWRVVALGNYPDMDAADFSLELVRFEVSVPDVVEPENATGIALEGRMSQRGEVSWWEGNTSSPWPAAARLNGDLVPLHLREDPHSNRFRVSLPLAPDALEHSPRVRPDAALCALYFECG